MNTLSDPLILTFTEFGYKVNKPNVEGGEFIDKNIGDQVTDKCFSILNDIGDMPDPILREIELRLFDIIQLLGGLEK